MYPQSWKSAYIKKLYYNIIVTTVSVIAAVSIGFVEPPLNSTEVSEAGSRESILIGWDLYWSLVALFIALWGLFYLIWKATRQRRLNTDL